MIAVEFRRSCFVGAVPSVAALRFDSIGLPRRAVPESTKR